MLALTLCASRAEAQFTGTVTAHIGVASAGDVRSAPVTLGGSMAVIDDDGIGVELDLGHLRDFNDEVFEESSATTVMLNVVAVYPHPTLRPFVNAGVGLLQVRTALLSGESAVTDNAGGWNAGGGVQYMVNELFGIRGDVRYFRHVQRRADVPSGDDGMFDFWRTSVGASFSWPIR